MRLRSEDKHHLRKSADRKAQISPVSGTHALICAFRSADFLRWCLSSEHNLTHKLKGQSKSEKSQWSVAVRMSCIRNILDLQHSILGTLSSNTFRFDGVRTLFFFFFKEIAWVSLLWVTGSAATTEKKFHTFSRLFQASSSTFSKPQQWQLTTKITNNAEQTTTVLFFFFFFFKETSLFFFYLTKKLYAFFFCFWSPLLEDQLVLLLPNKLPGSALDWLSRAKQPSALDVLGGEKRRTRKRTDKGFSLSKKIILLSKESHIFKNLTGPRKLNTCEKSSLRDRQSRYRSTVTLQLRKIPCRRDSSSETRR